MTHEVLTLLDSMLKWHLNQKSRGHGGNGCVSSKTSSNRDWQCNQHYSTNRKPLKGTLTRLVRKGALKQDAISIFPSWRYEKFHC